MPSAVKQQYLNIAIVPNIAADYGFRSGTALARFFARETGTTMTAWRRK